MMLNLRSKIFDELRPGARVVSHDYHFGDWQADDQHHLSTCPRKEKINGVPSATLYLLDRSRPRSVAAMADQGRRHGAVT